MAAPSSWKAWRWVSVAWARMGTEVGPPSTRSGAASRCGTPRLRSLRLEPAPPDRHLRYPPLAGTPKLSARPEISCPRSRRTPSGVCFPSRGCRHA